MRMRAIHSLFLSYSTTLYRFKMVSVLTIIVLYLFQRCGSHVFLKQPTSREELAGLDESSNPGSSSQYSPSFVCRARTPFSPKITLTAGGSLLMNVTDHGHHQGVCAIYLSYNYDAAPPLFFKLAEISSCSFIDRYRLDVPEWLPPISSAVLRWEWVGDNRDRFYANCVDVSISGKPSATLPYKSQLFPVGGHLNLLGKNIVGPSIATLSTPGVSLYGRSVPFSPSSSVTANTVNEQAGHEPAHALNPPLILAIAIAVIVLISLAMYGFRSWKTRQANRSMNSTHGLELHKRMPSPSAPPFSPHPGFSRSLQEGSLPEPSAPPRSPVFRTNSRQSVPKMRLLSRESFGDVGLILQPEESPTDNQV